MTPSIQKYTQIDKSAIQMTSQTLKHHVLDDNNVVNNNSPETCIKIKIIIPKRKARRTLFQEELVHYNLSNYKLENISQSPENEIGRIVEELIISKYNYRLIRFAERSAVRSKRKKNISITGEGESKNTKNCNEISVECQRNQESGKFLKSSKLLNNGSLKLSSSEEKIDNNDDNFGFEKELPEINFDDYSISTENVSELLSSSTSVRCYSTNSTLRSLPSYTSTPILKSKTENKSVFNKEEKSTCVKEENHLVNIQDRIINQIVKVIKMCKKENNFDTYVEAERLLLLANINKENKFFKNSNSNKTIRSKNGFGVVTLTNLSISLKQVEANILKKANDPIYFVCVLSCNNVVLSSATTLPDHNDDIRFKEVFTFQNLCSDFEIDLSVYALCALKWFTNKKKRIIWFQGNEICPSPNQFLPSIKPKMVEDDETKISSFSLIGKCKINLRSSENSKLNKVNNCLQELCVFDVATFQMKIKIPDSTRQNLSFVDLGIKRKDKPVRWNRLWSCIKGLQIQFWKYPEDDLEGPVVEIDLRNCLKRNVDVAKETNHFRPRTLELEIEEIGDQKIYEQVLYLLSFDTIEMMNNWNNYLNSLLGWTSQMKSRT